MPSAEQFEEVTRNIRAMIGQISDEGTRRQCGDAIRKAFAALHSIKQNHQELAGHTQLAAYCMLQVCQLLAVDMQERHLHPERIESRKHKPADGYRNTARQLAQSIAFKLWREDLQQQISLTSMSLHVWGKMIEMHYVEFLPDDYQELQHWIAPVAPDYARRQLRSIATSPVKNYPPEASEPFFVPLTRTAIQ